jgi:phage N-6-adenine-methyltransferase
MADRNDRMTPQWFVDQCASRFGMFLVDVAATERNRRCDLWFGPGSALGEDALKIDWIVPSVDVVVDSASLNRWCNPPYGPPGTIPKWIAKAREQRDKHGIRTLMLLLNDPSTAWCQDVKRTEWCEDVPFRLAFTAPDGSTKGNTSMEASLLVYIAPQVRNLSSRKGHR